MPWEARSLRLTVFPMLGSDLGQAPNWQALVGRPPEETVQRAGQFTEKGPLGEGRVLQLSKQIPIRADLVYGAVPDPNAEEIAPPSLGPLDAQVEAFGNYAEAFLGGAPPLQRVAFGAELFLAQESRQDAYDYLAATLHGAGVQLDGATDFIYQINRPRPSGVLEEVMINRLGKWSASQWQIMMEQGPAHRVMGPERYANNLTLDVNTAAEYGGPIPPESLLDVYRELVTHGREIAERGDEP